MKRFICVMLCALMLISCLSFNAVASEDIRILINGRLVTLTTPAELKAGDVFAAIEDVFKPLSFKIAYYDKFNMYTLTRNEKTMRIYEGKTDIYVDGAKKTLSVAPYTKDGKLMVPCDDIFKVFGETAVYDYYDNTYRIESPYRERVAYQSTLAPLYSDTHRDIPTEFERTSDYDDIMFFDNSSLEIPSGGTVIADMDDLLKAKSNSGTYTASISSGTENGETKAVIQIKRNISSSTSCIFRLPVISGITNGDTLFLKFDLKISSGATSDSRVQIQLQNDDTDKKAIWETIYADADWQTVYVPAKAQYDANELGIRPGTKKSTVEIKNFSLTNYGTVVTVDKLPFTGSDVYPEDELKPDAQWRKDAFERIDRERKGDFKVVVKDKNGNPVPDANVTFDMFESEYKFGTATQQGVISSNSTYKKMLGKYFNTAVNEHNMKWGPYVSDPTIARKQMNAAKSAGIKNLRGHAYVWEKIIGSDGETYLIPEFVLDKDGTVIDDKEQLQTYIKERIYSVGEEYAGEIYEWDVVNEIVDKTAFRSVHGDDMMTDWFEWARDAGEENDLVYNDFSHNFTQDVGGTMGEEMYGYAKYFKDNSVDVDTIGLQSHMEYNSSRASRLKTMTEHYNMFKSYIDLGYKTAVTEYSMDTVRSVYQANYTRDYYILAFSVPENTGFTIWGFREGNIYADNGMFMDKDWNLKLTGKALEDLVYNKFWTRNETAVTDEAGVATINGFYGDYDVTVEAMGEVKNISCAYHKGYDNIMEVIIDEGEVDEAPVYTKENSENDLFSFVYSGKIQVEGKLTDEYIPYDNQFFKGQVTLLLWDNVNAKIAHIAQTPIKEDKTYSFEFKKDGLTYTNGYVDDYRVILNVNGQPVTNSIYTYNVISDCVAFDFDVTNSDGKMKVVSKLNNLIKRKGIDYDIFTVFYGEEDRMLMMNKHTYASTGNDEDTVTVDNLSIPEGTKYVKVFVWLNNQNIPLDNYEITDIN